MLTSGPEVRASEAGRARDAGCGSAGLLGRTETGHARGEAEGLCGLGRGVISLGQGGKGEHGLGSEAVGLEAGFPIFLVFLSLLFFFFNSLKSN